MNIADKKEFRESFFTLLENKKNIVITSHLSPDDDSISSVLSLYQILTERMDASLVRILYSGKEASRFKSIPFFEKIEFVEDISSHTETIDALIMLDGGQYYRFSKNPEIIKTIETTICIDHHSSLPDTFTLSHIDKSLSSNAEVLFSLFDNTMTLTKSLAETLMLGILGDTGNFTFMKASQSNVLLIAKKLVDAGSIDIQSFQSTYRKIPERVFLVIQELMKNASRKKIGTVPEFVYSFITNEYVKSGGFLDEEISAAKSIFTAHYGTSLTGISWGFVLIPKGDKTHISMRSLPGSVNVRDMLERMNVGGGHDLAAGGIFSGNEVEKNIQSIFEWLETNQIHT